MATVVTAACALCRLWTAAYTAGLPASQRDTRRAEIESDLWEFRRDLEAQGLPAVRSAAEVLARLFFGIADDLSWRIEQVESRRRRARTAWIVATSLLFAAFSWYLALNALQPGLPSPPPPPMTEVIRTIWLAPPPPPPPPPMQPTGFANAKKDLPPPPPPPPAPPSSSAGTVWGTGK